MGSVSIQVTQNYTRYVADVTDKMAYCTSSYYNKIQSYIGHSHDVM
jgi:hypothetical protein